MAQQITRTIPPAINVASSIIREGVLCSTLVGHVVVFSIFDRVRRTQPALVATPHTRDTTTAHTHTLAPACTTVHVARSHVRARTHEHVHVGRVKAADKLPTRYHADTAATSEKA